MMTRQKANKSSHVTIPKPPFLSQGARSITPEGNSGEAAYRVTGSTGNSIAQKLSHCKQKRRSPAHSWVTDWAVGADALIGPLENVF